MSTRKRKSTVDNSDDEEWKPSTSSKSTRKTTKKATNLSTATTKITKKVSRKQTKLPKARLCSVQGCLRQVQQGGVCCKHGAKTVRALCRHEDCTNVAKRGGLCRRHGAFKLATCSHSGCKRVAIVGVYCGVHKTHHSSALLSKDVSTNEERDNDIPPPPKNKKVRVYQHTICIHDGCHNKADDCTEHDNAKPKSVSPDPVTPKLEKFCIEVGCTNLGNHRGGACREHRQVKTVTPTQSGEEVLGKCENVILCNHEGGCMNKAVYDGVCVEHGAMRRIYASNNDIAHTSGPSSQEGNNAAAVLKEEARATPEMIQESEGAAYEDEGAAYEDELDDVELDFLEDMYQPLFG